MTFRPLAAVALAGAALLAPATPANALICGGLEKCPYVALQAVLDTYADVEERVEDIPPIVYIDYPDVVENCHDVPPYFDDVCVLP